MEKFNWNKLQNGSDIRGVALPGIPDESVNLTPRVAQTLGQAFSIWLSQTLSKATPSLTISLGRDSRLSGPQLRDAVIEGIVSTGAKVYDFAMASTPAMFMSTITEGFKCDGAIMLTASHLPFNRNGLKFFTPQGGLDKQDITAILALAAENQFITSDTRGSVTQADFISIYAQQFVDKIRREVNHPDNYNQPLTGLKIIVDAGNGAGGFYVDKVLQPLGAHTTGSQFLDPDGNFPNHIPNPEDKEAMASICNAVTQNQGDLGIIFDTDVDRAGAVDAQGKELNRNRLIALMAAIVLTEHPGSAIVTDSITSDGLTKFITDLGGVHHRFKRGYKNVINESVRLNQTGQESWLAMETSGHGAMQENYFLDDGAYLVTKILIKLAQLKLAGKPLEGLIISLQEPVESQEFRIKINTEDFQKYGNLVIEKLAEFTNQQDNWEIVPNNYEGVRVACKSPAEQGWFLLRLSLHDPVIPLNIESNIDQGVEKIATRLKGFFESYELLDLSAFN
jgi:phosphomannomutase